jgi:beta-galactosidase
VTRTSFNADWTVKPKVSSFMDLIAASDTGITVTLPDDAMLRLPRSATGSEGPSTGYFPGGTIEYSKTFDTPEDWRAKRVSLEFQGVYRDAMVFVNGVFAGQRRNGYVPFRVPLDAFLRYGQANRIRVEARAHHDSRWYSGLGIHRDTILIVTPLAHIAADGVRASTPVVDDEGATVEIATTVRNEDLVTRALALRVDLRDQHGQLVTSEQVPVTVAPGTSTVVRRRFYVRAPELWSVDRPYLYEIQATLLDDDREIDSAIVALGIRTLRLDPVHGLRINGETVKLRGACIHHDNGPLGAAAIRRAEERRIELLKAAGFNAIRSAHNPLSPAMLDACDRLGMLVLDEAFDMWFEGMKAFDYSLDFAEWWERDIEAMVLKDINHPSVIAFSIGNEIPETGSGLGAEWGRRLAEKVRSLDHTRFVTNAISSFWAVSGEILDEFKREVSALETRGVNDVMNAMGEIFDRITTSELVTERTAESHAAVDIAGLNYAEQRYVSDGERFPHRVILGTETNPRNIAAIWRLVQALPHVIGDFTWTGWDYLGEAGIGRVDYPDEDYVPTGISAPYPWLTGWVGDIDLTGHRRPQSYYRETVFGLRHTPYIAVHRPQFHGRPTFQTPWSWTDSVSSWSWDIQEGSPATVDVYSDADEVELLLNGRSIGRSAVGVDKAFLAQFELNYEPGELVAVSYIAGEEQARTALRTADGPLHLTATAERDAIRADDTDLAYITITLDDTEGNLAGHRDRLVSVEVSGAGVLSALGSGDPRTEEPFGASQCTTFDGRALAIVRPTGPGDIEIRVSADGCEPVAATVTATEVPSDAASRT